MTNPDMPADIAAAIEKFEASAWSHGFQRRMQSSDPNSRAALEAAILRHLPKPRPKRSAEDEEALRMGGDR